jgi:hypothetical protein
MRLKAIVDDAVLRAPARPPSAASWGLRVGLLPCWMRFSPAQMLSRMPPQSRQCAQFRDLGSLCDVQHRLMRP